MIGQPWCMAEKHSERLIAGGRCSCHDYGVELNWMIRKKSGEVLRAREILEERYEELEDLRLLRAEARAECGSCGRCSMCLG